jgi:hypothetical protein
VTWDTKGLEVYAKNDHPAVLKFRKEGKPYVVVRKPTELSKPKRKKGARK